MTWKRDGGAAENTSSVSWSAAPQVLKRPSAEPGAQSLREVEAGMTEQEAGSVKFCFVFKVWYLEEKIIE